jgi:hypothetical protein
VLQPAAATAGGDVLQPAAATAGGDVLQPAAATAGGDVLQPAALAAGGDVLLPAAATAGGDVAARGAEADTTEQAGGGVWILDPAEGQKRIAALSKRNKTQQERMKRKWKEEDKAAEAAYKAARTS